jgi:3-dehydroquinate synthase
MPTVVHSQAATSRAKRTVQVALGQRSYNVLIGPDLLAEAGRQIAMLPGKPKAAIVTDQNVAHHHLGALEASLRAEGRLAGSVIIPAGESSKSFSELEPLCESLLKLGLERGDVIIPLGGGVIGDLAGFAAGILRRGIRFVQIPTSLLAQVDSSVGGKTGINSRQGKNLIGVFHQPSLVLADTDTLKTLPSRQLKSGYAEVAKYGLLGDAKFFAWLEDNYQAVLALEEQPLIEAIETSVKAKADIVARDELEAGDRALLNLGHTFGHALEAFAGYSDRLLHGEAISIGMTLAFRLSEQLEQTPAGTAGRVEKHFKTVGLPTEIGEIPGGQPTVPEILTLMAQDKKVASGRMTLVLAKDIGKAFLTRDISRDDLEDFLSVEMSRV